MTAVNRSNELESLAEVIRMIGSSEEYTAAIMAAALVRTFKDTKIFIWNADERGMGEKMIEVDIWHSDSTKDVSGPLLSVIIPDKYRELFEEDAK